jgi:hypothetical protein
MSSGEDFYNNITQWILHAAIRYPDTKLTDLFIFIGKDGKLELNYNNELIKEWKAELIKNRTLDLGDPELKAKWDAYNETETSYYRSLGLEWPIK